MPPSGTAFACLRAWPWLLSTISPTLFQKHVHLYPQKQSFVKVSLQRTNAGRLCCRGGQKSKGAEKMKQSSCLSFPPFVALVAFSALLSSFQMKDQPEFLQGSLADAALNVNAGMEQATLNVRVTWPNLLCNPMRLQLSFNLIQFLSEGRHSRR